MLTVMLPNSREVISSVFHSSHWFRFEISSSKMSDHTKYTSRWDLGWELLSELIPRNIHAQNSFSGNFEIPRLPFHYQHYYVFPLRPDHETNNPKQNYKVSNASTFFFHLTFLSNSCNVPTLGIVDRMIRAMLISFPVYNRWSFRYVS